MRKVQSPAWLCGCPSTLPPAERANGVGNVAPAEHTFQLSPLNYWQSADTLTRHQFHRLAQRILGFRRVNFRCHHGSDWHAVRTHLERAFDRAMLGGESLRFEVSTTDNPNEFSV
jgi:hypothetical protein